MIAARCFLALAVALAPLLRAGGAESPPDPAALLAKAAEAGKAFTAKLPYHLVLSIGSTAVEDGFPVRVWAREHGQRRESRVELDYAQFIKTQLVLGDERWSVFDGMAIQERWEQSAAILDATMYVTALQPLFDAEVEPRDLSVKPGRWRGETVWVVDQRLPAQAERGRAVVIRHTIRAADSLVLMRESFDAEGARLSFQRTEYATHEAPMDDALFRVPTEGVTRYVAESVADSTRIVAEHRAKRAQR